jgi:hypothetical protein
MGHVGEMNPYVMASVFGCGGDGRFLGRGFASLAVEGRSFFRTVALGGLVLNGTNLSPERWVPGEREGITGDEITSRSLPLDFPYC